MRVGMGKVVIDVKEPTRPKNKKQPEQIALYQHIKTDHFNRGCSVLPYWVSQGLN